MADSIKRLNYFDYQFLRAKDFTDEQTYHLTMRRAHNRTLHSWGVAEGLEVKVASGSKAVTVAPGMAIDRLGHEIVLMDPAQTGDLTGAGPWFVTIAYQEQTTDPSTETGTKGNTRNTEMAVVSQSATAPADPGLTLVLGVVSVDSGGNLFVQDGDDPAKRRYASTVGGDFAARSITLTDPNVVATQWPKFTTIGGGVELSAGMTLPAMSVLNTLEVGMGFHQGGLYLSGDTSGGCSFSFNARRNANNTAWEFPEPSLASVTVEMDARRGNAGRFEIYGTTAADKTHWKRRLSLNCETGDILLCENGGSVGIGVNPAGEGRIDVNGRIRLRRAADGSAGLWLNQNAGDRAFVGMADDNQVGLYSSVRAWGLLMNVNDLTCRFTVPLIAAGAAYPSDERLKTGVEPITGALDKIAQIRGVNYRMAGTEEARAEVGVIAQEVERVVPELVHTNSDDGMKAVDYGRLAAVLVEAVKELTQQVAALRSRVLDLETGAPEPEPAAANG